METMQKNPVNYFQNHKTICTCKYKGVFCNLVHRFSEFYGKYNNSQCKYFSQMFWNFVVFTIFICDIDHYFLSVLNKLDIFCYFKNKNVIDLTCKSIKLSPTLLCI